MKTFLFVAIAFVITAAFAEDLPLDYGQCLIIVKDPPKSKFGTKEYDKQQARSLILEKKRYISRGMTNSPFWHLKLNGLMSDGSNRVDRVQIWNLKDETRHWIPVGQTIGNIHVLEADQKKGEVKIQVDSKEIVLEMGKRRGEESSKPFEVVR